MGHGHFARRTCGDSRDVYTRCHLRAGIFSDQHIGSPPPYSCLVCIVSLKHCQGCAQCSPRRLLDLASHADVLSDTPRGRIVNVALANPACLSFDRETGDLRSNANQSRVIGTLMGRTTSYCNSKMTVRQVSITPFAQGWLRFTAVLGKISNQSILYFRSWKGGVSFGASSSNSSGRANPRRQKKSEESLTDGLALGPEEESSFVFSHAVP